MSFSAKVLADSISPEGVRLTSVEATYPRFVHSELMTHRVMSRNSSSSRAIPSQKLIDKIKQNPVVPFFWGKNQPGMVAREELDDEAKQLAEEEWLFARDAVVSIAEKLTGSKLHKQLTNRLIEPWMWITVIITATEWSNFFALRSHPDAQPEIAKASDLIQEALAKSTPKKLGYGQWHLPLVFDEDYEAFYNPEHDGNKDIFNPLKKICVGRCCRVSYLTHDGRRSYDDDIRLHDQLADDAHCSPYEHPARPMTQQELLDYSLLKNLEITVEDNKPKITRKNNIIPFCGNFRGWVQYRKEIPNEDDFSKVAQKRLNKNG